ncbi:MAG TPA: hypothetical protein VEB68_02500 [Croceibacterium sp.]|nr:hypothetical protein [Croceibacterium sp.]
MPASIKRGGALTLLAALCAALASCTTGEAHSPTSIGIAGARVFPESITSDNLGTIYVGSNPGTIYRARSGDSEAVPWIVPDAENGLQSVFGVLADDPRGLLWVCSNPGPGASGAATLKAFELTSGRLHSGYPFPGTARALCNDIAIAPDGTVHATDTIGGRIVTLAPGASTLAEFAASAELRGIDGIAFADDGTLYVNNVQQNLLQRVERAEGRFGGLTTIATSLPLSGPDGLRAIGGNRFLQAEGPGGRVSLVTIADDRAVMLPLATGLDYPASMTLVGRTVYVPEGKIGYLFDAAKRDADPGPFTIHAVALEAGQ